MLPGFSGHLVSEFFLESEMRATAPYDPAIVHAARQRLLAWRQSIAWLGPASSVRTLFERAALPLVEALGFDRTDGVDIAGSIVVATVRRGAQGAGLVVAGWGEPRDSLWRTAVIDARRRGVSWSLLFNGTHLRLVDAERLFSRRFVEFDVSLALDDERTFAALWSVMRAAACTPADGTGRTSLHALVDESERHASGVCQSLRGGVLAACGEVLGALVARPSARPARPLDDAFEQALTIVYRILFLLFAEARALVPVWHPVYRDSYSLGAIRAAAERPGGAVGLWDALRAVARLAHGGCRAGDLRVAPFNGRLFAPSRTPLAERRDLDDEAARRAVLALSTRRSPGGAGRERIAYRDLGVEQLGAVYETLLDYTPHVRPAEAANRRPRSRVTLERGPGIRKSTGTFYTPQPLAAYLVRRALGPLVADAPPDRILRLRIVDPAMGSGAFLVAACHYLAAAYEAAEIRTGGCRPTDFGEAERASIRRAIAERCLYGVDLNPMAAQLARLSLWLTTLAIDRPLTFLDHRLQVGDSLVGAWIAQLKSAPLAPRRRGRPDASLPLFDDRVQTALKLALPVRFTLEASPGDTLEQVRAKERALAALHRRDQALERWKRVADVWCASWFASVDRPVPATAFHALADAICSGTSALPATVAERYLSASEAVAAARRFFHWELEFPEVFFGPDGMRLPAAGFDAVIGNPPWDMLRADAGDAAGRAAARDEVERGRRFTRDSGVYVAQTIGHANRYQLFVERAASLVRAGGRLGLVLPGGIVADHGSAPLRRLLFSTCDVDALVGFDNRQGLFPIHRSVRFVLLTASAGAPTRTIACRLGERDPAALDGVGDEPAAASSWFPLRVSACLLDRISGEDRSIPDLRSPMDVAIVERTASLFPRLGSAEGWAARFGRELNATDDRACFRAPGSGLPVIEGKQIAPFHVDVAAARHAVAATEARRRLGARRVDRPRLAYRDVASATNRLTLIAALLPRGSVSTHTVFCLRTPLPPVAQHFLCGLFNSFVVNYLVRLRVNTHVTTAIVERLPAPTRERAPRAFRTTAALARLLSRRWSGSAYARLQAEVARLYELSPDEFRHILSTFPLVAEDDRQAAFQAFERVRNGWR